MKKSVHLSLPSLLQRKQQIGAESLLLDSMVAFDSEQLQQRKKEAGDKANLILIKESNGKVGKRVKTFVSLAFKFTDTSQEQKELLSSLKQMMAWESVDKSYSLNN